MTSARATKLLLLRGRGGLPVRRMMSGGDAPRSPAERTRVMAAVEGGDDDAKSTALGCFSGVSIGSWCGGPTAWAEAMVDASS